MRASSRKRYPAPRPRIARDRKSGYRLGFDHGYWFGQCESVLKRTAVQIGIKPVHVLFVATGKGYPYAPLDEAIAATLRRNVGQLTVTDAGQPVGEIAARIRPDVVIVLDGLQFDTAKADEVRRAGIRIAVWFTDDPYYTDMTAKLALHYDDVFTLELNCVEFYRRLGCESVHYLPLGVYQDEFRPRNPELNKRHDILFIGSAFWRRVEFFDQITDYLASRDTHISGIWWERLKRYNRLKGKIALGRWMGPRETAGMYSGAKIVINMHRAPEDDTFNSNSAGITAVSPNPRTFEVSACAALQLTDIRDDLASFYKPGSEIVTYSSPSDMVEKIEYYLTHEEERRRIAMQGMARTMREHTYDHRLRTMLSILFPDR
ncbi:CgeB family protein [Paenibacillus humicola]|uniref:CgeB family protein n=1 Tax=Paenibacillus humicola TaxID=3110540 RepID=UPI00237B9DD0|nr:glycosyltransferase [Paenibacillus humicola]